MPPLQGHLSRPTREESKISEEKVDRIVFYVLFKFKLIIFFFFTSDDIRFHLMFGIKHDSPTEF